MGLKERLLKERLLKNARNYAEYLRKKERGPVKAFFHITKNENVPAIEQQGLLTNHPNANINSANHPFRKHGTDAGGVWVTTEPTAFPVYGTTIGGKNGNAAARADALSTIKIEVPLPELRKMKAVQDPYGKNILRKGDDPRAVEKFGTWAGINVPTTVFLNDIRPQWLKNIGYVEERAPSYRLIDTDNFPLDMEGSWRLDEGNILRMLDKSRLRDFSGLTGHRHNDPQDAAKSPYRFVEDYLNRNRPIKDRMAKLPQASYRDPWEVQFLEFKPITEEGSAPATAAIWTEEFKPYMKIGEDTRKRYIFQPGAISRGMGHLPQPDKRSLQKRRFNWDAFNRAVARGDSPEEAMADAMPDYILDWDNIVYSDDFGYAPKFKSVFNRLKEGGRISAGKQAEAPFEIDGEPITFRRLLELNKDPDFDYWRWHSDFVDALNELRDLSGGKWDYLDGGATWNDILKATLKAQTHPWYHPY